MRKRQKGVDNSCYRSIDKRKISDTQMKIPRIIPPKTVVRLSRYDASTPAWRRNIGREFRVGYYSKQDGLDCIWLVNDEGEYEQTTDRQNLLMYFDILKFGAETDIFGAKRSPLGPRRQGRPVVS
jgi:hypothetical protein